MQAVLYTLLIFFVLAGASWALAYRPDLSPGSLEREYAGGASQFTQVDGVRFHYRHEGQGDPVVLLHGLTANLFVWDPWAQRLSEHFQVIRPDLPGHGLTGPDPEGRYAWPQIAHS